MTTPPRPAKRPAKTKPATADAAGKDALAGLPPMPKTKPKKTAASTVADDTKATAKAADGSPMITRKELFARIKARTGKVKGSDVRAVMEVVLDELGTAVVNGESVRIPSLGTLKVQRHKPQAKADVVICKLNRKKPGPKKPNAAAKDPLAKPAEGS